MAQAIHCDVHGRDHLADVLVSQIATGDTMAACFLGYVELARALVADSDVRDAAEAASSAADTVAGVDPDQAEVDATDAEAEARLGAIQAAGEPAQLGELAGLEPVDELPRSPAAEALGVTQVVPKGASRSRKAHQARQRARRRRVAPEGPGAADAAPGPPDGLQDDPGGGTAPA
jgi:hypothetical protein